MSLRWNVVLVVIAAAVLPVVVGVLAVYDASHVGESGEREADLARVTARLIVRDLAGTQRVFKLGTQLFDLTSLKEDEVTGVLRMLYKQDEDVDVVVLLNADDQAVVDPVFLRAEQIQAGTETSGHLPVDEADLGLMLQHLPIAEAREQGTALSGVYISTRKNVAMVAGAVVVPAGEGRSWVLGFERSLRRVQQVVATGAGAGQVMFVVDAGGRLVAHPDGERFLRRETLDRHPLVARFLAEERPAHGRWPDPEGRMHVGAFQRIESLEWAVVVQRQEKDASAVRWRIPGWAWVAWIVLALVVVVAVFMMQRSVWHVVAEMRHLGEDAEQRAATLKRLQASLLESGKLSAIGDLGAGVAHEFNNPLGGILGLTQLLLRKKKEGDPDLQFLRRIEQEAKRCKKITDNLLRFSEHQGIDHREPLRLDRVAGNTVDLLSQKLQSQRIQIERQFVADLPRVVGNEGQLQRAILNVLTNAETAMPAGGNLILSTSVENGRAVLRIRDTGRGIPAENLDRVFEPFFTTKDEWRGAGLGLSVVYQIVKDHDGTVHIESEPDRGTTVILSFPAAAEAGDRKSSVPLA